MNELFLKVVNLGISASWLILVVLFLRLLLKKGPKLFNVLLWGLVAVRLICPFSLESRMSLIPSTETIPMNIERVERPAIDSGIVVVDNMINPVISKNFTPKPIVSANPLQVWISLGAFIWLTGMIGMLFYSTISYRRLRHRVSTAVLYRDNIFQSENVVSPFVLGVIRPRIYLPFYLKNNELVYVVAHEQAHICRKDHWWKPLGFLLLTIHWFNPLMWMAYVLLCQDIEMACDEKVIGSLNNERRADYTQALVACSVKRGIIAACPLAFGEAGVKVRVKSVMNYKKPTFWIILISVVSCLVVGVCFLTNPPTKGMGGTKSETDLDTFGIQLEEATGEYIYSYDKQGNQIQADSVIMPENESVEMDMQAYSTFLSGDRTLINNDILQWWIPDLQSNGILEYEYTYLDLDGDGMVELLVQMVNSPPGYNGVFHYAEGELFCWNSDGTEGSCRDYPLMDGTMVRQYDTNGNSCYTIFRYLSNGERVDIHTLFVRKELVPEDSTVPCPYYTVDGEEVSQEVFEEQLKSLVTEKIVEPNAWIKN